MNENSISQPISPQSTPTKNVSDLPFSIDSILNKPTNSTLPCHRHRMPGHFNFTLPFIRPAPPAPIYRNSPFQFQANPFNLTPILRYNWRPYEQRLSSSPKNAPLNTLAITIMTSWYEKNRDYPYVDYDTAETIARAGGITPEQVRKWFANKRVRSGYTKSQSRKRRHSLIGLEDLQTSSKQISIGKESYSTSTLSDEDSSSKPPQALIRHG